MTEPMFGDYYEDLGDEEEVTIWEQPMQRSWDMIQENEKGELKPIQLIEQRAKKRKLRLEYNQPSGNVIQKGMIRYIYFIIDFSDAMKQSDLKPTRRLLTIQLMEEFIKEFFDQNPISQLGIIASYNRIAEKVTELSGNPKQQIENISRRTENGGEFSLQNSLDVAKQTLGQIPSYGTREIVVIMGSLGTCDPGDIYETIKQLRKKNIRVSVIGLSAEMHVCKMLTKQTNGLYTIAIDKQHFRELLLQHVSPLPIPKLTSDPDQRVSDGVGRKWIKMGFPQKRSDTYPSLCACHNEFKHGGYFCPKCKTKFCELPIDCQVCDLTLVSSPHLARSYHHLLPVPEFQQLLDDINEVTKDWFDVCFSCLHSMDSKLDIRVQCPSCKKIFCVDCDEYIHNSLHNCPGCTSSVTKVDKPAHNSTTPP